MHPDLLHVARLRSALTIVSPCSAGVTSPGTYRKSVIVHAIVPVIIGTIPAVKNCRAQPMYLRLVGPANIA